MNELVNEDTRVRIREGEAVVVDRQVLEAASGRDLPTLAGHLRRLVTLAPSWQADRVQVAAGRMVGSLRVGRLRLDVQPRLAASELATLIRYAWRRTRTHGRTRMAIAKEGLDELVGRLLADEAQAIREQGLARRYERREERLPVVRGRPAFAQSFPWNAQGPTALVCAHHLLTADNLHNRLLRAALERAVLLDVSTGTRRSLGAHQAVWASIASALEPTPADFEQARQRRDRLADHYALAHRLGVLLMRGQRPARLFEEGPAAAGLVLDMANLFEAFVTRVLAEWATPLGLQVRAQQPDRQALLDAEGDVYRRVRPDLVVYRDGRPVAVVDAKYKDYWPAQDAQGQPRRKVSNADLYQLFFYAQRLQAKHDLAAPPAAFIVAPLPAADERASRPAVEQRYRRVVWRAAREQAGDVRLVLLPLTRLLRQLGSLPDEAARLFDVLLG